MNRKQYFEKLHLAGVRDRLDLERLEDAYWFAKAVHRGQNRDAGERYFEHCRRVALNLLKFGGTSANEMIVALLHDCIEDCFFPERVLRRQFGDAICEAVYTLSKVRIAPGETPGQVYKVKKDIAVYWQGILQADAMIRRIKIADRLDNLRDMHIWPEARRKKYIRETKQYILPIARATDGQLAEILEGKISEERR